MARNLPTHVREATSFRQLSGALRRRAASARSQLRAIWRGMEQVRKALDPSARRWVGYWLFAVAAAVGAMTVIGGVTRLTESGLSMVEWRPLIGWLPPTSAEEWDRVFQLYRATPEYQKVNAGMSLAEFKTIFWWEFIHRVWGRLIGVIYALPMLVFWLKGWVPGPLKGRLLLLLALGGLQGLIGWWMVKSGLVDRPDVSHYRLAVHLLMAFVIAGLLVWTALGLLGDRPAPAPEALRTHARWLLAGLLFVVVLGAFVAGTNAGFVYNTFPLMENRLVPPDYLALEPWWRNPLEGLGPINFHHRWAAILAVAATLKLWRIGRNTPELEAGQRRALKWLAIAVCCQFLLGIATLVTVVWPPLAALHQAMALMLILTAVWTVWSFEGRRA